MTSFINDIRSFFVQRKRVYAKKMRWMALACVGAVVVLGALAIALSKIIPALIVIAGSVAVATWCFLKIRKMELATLIQYIRDVLDKLFRLLKEKEDDLRQFEGNPAKFSLKEILSLANEEERNGLAEFTGIKFEDAEQFDFAVRKKATNDIRSLIKRIKGVDKELSIATYSDMIDLAGEKFKLNRGGRKDRDFEAHLVKTAFEKMVDTMDDKDREVLEREISKYAEEHLGKKNLDLALASGGLVAANLGGFATYTMASSLLAGVSSTFGVALPFAAYTTLSSTLAVALGPVGLIALGSWGLHKITSPNIKTTILTVLAVASIRERLIFEYPEKRDELKKEIDNLAHQISDLETLLGRAILANKPDEAFLAIAQDINPEAIEHLPKTDS